MANQGTEHMDLQQLRPEYEEHEPNQLELSVLQCAFFFLFSGASIMVLSIQAPLINREHIFVGFLLFIIGSLLWLLRAFLLHGSPMAIMVGTLVVRVILRLFCARD